jgi:hypothetical protein
MHHAAGMFVQILPKTPTNVTGAPLEPAVQALVGHHDGAASSSSAVFGVHDRFAEIHILAHALHSGDALSPPILRRMCELKNEIWAEQQRSGMCLRPWWHQEAAAAPASTQSPVPGPAVDEATGTAPQETAGAPMVLETPSKRTGTQADGLVAAAPGDRGAAPRSLRNEGATDSGCLEPFSILAVRPTIRAYGYGDALDLLDTIAARVTDVELSAAHSACAVAPAARGALLCAVDELGCAPGPCAAATPRCIRGALDPCDLLSALDPTMAELRDAASLPATPLDAGGCDALDVDGLTATLRAFRVLLEWSRRSTRFADFALLVDALVDTDFAATGRSAVTRMVFGVPRRGGGDDTALAALAARRAVAASGTDVDFVWRQWHYFDVYASSALVRDVSFAFGALVGLAAYSWWTLGSAALTAVALTSILLSFPASLAIYALVLGARWIGVLHFLGIFVILGIGADDVFVVVEHWKVLLHLPPPLSAAAPCSPFPALM